MVRVVGAGLAGCEAAYQLLKRGFEVEIIEMRPLKQTSAHTSADFAELVCSNSLKSEDEFTSSGLLKYELKQLDCLLLKCADIARVEAGSALAVDRKKFSACVLNELKKFNNLTITIREVVEIDESVPTIYATGPLTSDGLFSAISKIVGNALFFFDAVAPIVDASTIDTEKAFFQGRYDKGGADYLNCPMNKSEYDVFYKALIEAETVKLRDFEGAEVFEGCMPVEVMAKRGYDTMRHGMLKPMGLTDVRTNIAPFAVVQLRKETKEGSAYNMVGFQTNLKFDEQKRVFSLIPALENAEFLRLGVMHRNSYIRSPKHLDDTFKLIGHDNVYFAGQITGVEGYVESIMSGLLVGIHLARSLEGKLPLPPPTNTICGALSNYVANENISFQPMNSNFGILPYLDIKNKVSRKKEYCLRAMREIIEWYKLII